MEPQDKVKVLFVCLGNICRSPMAEAVFRHLVDQAGLTAHFEIASAATSHWEVGEPPHPGTQKVLREHGIYTRPEKRATQITADDYEEYDYIVAMDGENLADMPSLPRISLLLDFAPDGSPREVPDPYYNGRFDYVYSLVEQGCRGLLEHIQRERGI